MRDLENSILARAVELQRHRDEQATRNEQMRVAQVEDEERNDAELRLTMEIGMRAVDLLISYDIDSRPVWDRKVVGKQTVPVESRHGSYTREVDTIDWFEQGQGWEVYRTVFIHDGASYHSAIGLQDDGRIFEIGERGIPPAIGSNSKDKRGGLAVQRYVDPSSASSILESDSFANGLAYRINDWGIYTVTTSDHTD